MTVLVDTSALYALLVATDAAHDVARRAFARHAEPGRLVTHNYVVVETVSLLQVRIGTDAVRSLVDELLPALIVGWVDAETHAAALARVADGPRSVSLVDRVSFAVMRRRGITTAFAFDEDFRREGFEMVPES
ncbi:MAG: PIN domain-containing protein [Actinomycetota bacterium]|nr:PIN domain-containing protein [Actinomycetota bacterium]